jgi:hypothetical protein
MKTILLAATAAAALTIAMPVPLSHAQMSMGAEKDPLQLQYEREKQIRDQDEKAYNATMKRLKSQGSASNSSDPWKSVRPATQPGAKR